MSDTLKVLSQNALSATTLTDCYTVPSLTQTIVRCITVCNRGGSATTFRISVAVAGAADATKQYTHYDVPIGANETLALEMALTLAASDVLRAYAGNGNLTVQAFGLEIT